MERKLMSGGVIFDHFRLSFKIRGIEARQHSTPPFIEDIQRDCLDRLDGTRCSDVSNKQSTNCRRVT